MIPTAMINLILPRSCVINSLSLEPSALHITVPRNILHCCESTPIVTAYSARQTNSLLWCLPAEQRVTRVCVKPYNLQQQFEASSMATTMGLSYHRKLKLVVLSRWPTIVV